VAAEVSSPERMDGTATLTMVTSSSDMKPTTSETASTRQRRGSGSYASSVAAGAPSVCSSWVIAASLSPARSTWLARRDGRQDGPMKAVQARVTGRVQGVSFRWYTQERACSLGVTGWVSNEPDGSVLLHAEGEDDAVDALVTWCHDGPSSARVTDVAVRDAAPSGATSFEVRH
jgi:acylphosphatase